ncbi:divergent polysaccharide deacetylase family protein [Paenibacillus sp. FSL R7-0179]|uniref:divergent polysaccharide deacetylase family protein n=1 Tax=Paenibacillus sp. FSL R7-0179 TaxID=2921672 RepID=UPI0030F81533
MKISNHRVKRVLLYPLAAVLIMSAALIPPHGVSVALADKTASASAPADSSRDNASGNLATGEQQQALSRVAVIIDDFGNSMRGTEEMFNLPVKITVAVMPFLRSSEQDARRAHELGFDVLVHLPMEPRQGKPEWLGPGAVLTSMNDAEVRGRVEAALDNVPYAIGINNHMGSKVTGDERVMGIVLAVCKERGLFFVDSHTNYRSVAGRMARELGMPPVENHIFLDDVHSASHVAKQMKLVQERALSQKFCVTIGHVGIQGKETAAGIRSGIAGMKDKVQFVGISDLVREEWKWNSRLTLP